MILLLLVFVFACIYDSYASSRRNGTKYHTGSEAASEYATLVPNRGQPLLPTHASRPCTCGRTCTKLYVIHGCRRPPLTPVNECSLSHSFTCTRPKLCGDALPVAQTAGRGFPRNCVSTPSFAQSNRAAITRTAPPRAQKPRLGYAPHAMRTAGRPWDKDFNSLPFMGQIAPTPSKSMSTPHAQDPNGTRWQHDDGICPKMG